ncbi:MAG TPA: hypothetical protein PLD25_29185 [Chloroflexota bacterium]|nr:hypothetical protein [Chloroflexota bacterium]HUM70626.1 hypothetical protein [Chloroflexota bacterium]
MPDKPSANPLAAFPRREVAFQFSRRDLLHLIQDEMRVSEDEARGIPGCRLADLGQVADDYLAQVVPVIVPECQILVAQGWVWGRLPSWPQPQPLFALDTAVTQAFNLFNGRNDLGTIGLQLARDLHWPEAESFTLVRGLFLHLVQRRICLPK